MTNAMLTLGVAMSFGLTAMVGSLANPDPSPMPAPPLEVPAAMFDFAAGESCGSCDYNCPGCNPWSCDSHKVEGPTGPYYTHAECLETECGAHPPCGSFANLSLQAVWDGLTEDDMEKVMNHLPFAGGGGYLNLERGSIQVLSCNGTGVMANIPLQPNQISALMN